MSDAQVKQLSMNAERPVFDGGAAIYGIIEGDSHGWGVGVSRCKEFGDANAYGERYEIAFSRITDNALRRRRLEYSGTFSQPFVLGLSYSFCYFGGGGVEIESVAPPDSEDADYAALFVLEGGLLLGRSDGRVLFELRATSPRDWTLWRDDAFLKSKALGTLSLGCIVRF
jgi:hypothetical protein